MKPIYLTCAMALACLSACNTTPTGTIAATALVHGCADSDLNSKAVLYFGPSNQIGPGSVWSRLGPTGGYQPQWRLQDMNVDSHVIDLGQPFSCELSNTSALAASASLSVLSSVANASAQAEADFSRARVVSVSASSAAWDTVIAGPYNAALQNIADPSIKRDVQGPQRLILRRALRLDNYHATLDFDESVKPQIKARYSGGVLGKSVVGDVGAELKANWTGDNKLELVATQRVYVAGEFAELQGGQWVSTRGGEARKILATAKFARTSTRNRTRGNRRNSARPAQRQFPISTNGAQ